MILPAICALLVLPQASADGERDLSRAAPVLKKLVVEQPYGKTWLKLARTAPGPKDRAALGEAKTHGALGQDRMEVQQQAQYLETTDTELVYGVAWIRGVRVFRYGKLRAVRLVIEPFHKPDPAEFASDLAAIAAAWADPIGAFALGSDFRVVRNDLVDPKKKQPPLVIEIVPVSGTSGSNP
jgi:hypothetical protein